jgi:hypothetical protein
LSTWVANDQKAVVCCRAAALPRRGADLAHDQTADHDGEHPGRPDQLGEQVGGERDDQDGEVLLQRVGQQPADVDAQPGHDSPGQ